MRQQSILNTFIPTNVANADEAQNNNRAVWAAAGVAAFARATRLEMVDGLETAVQDLVCDIAHLCDRTGLNLSTIIISAARHYAAETNAEAAASGVNGTQFDALEVL